MGWVGFFFWLCEKVGRAWSGVGVEVGDLMGDVGGVIGCAGLGVRVWVWGCKL